MDTKDVIAYISGYVGCEPGLTCNNDDRLETAKSEIATLTAERDRAVSNMNALLNAGEFMEIEAALVSGDLSNRHAKRLRYRRSVWEERAAEARKTAAALSREGE